MIRHIGGESELLYVKSTRKDANFDPRSGFEVRTWPGLAALCWLGRPGQPAGYRGGAEHRAGLALAWLAGRAGQPAPAKDFYRISIGFL